MVVASLGLLHGHGQLANRGAARFSKLILLIDCPLYYTVTRVQVVFVLLGVHLIVGALDRGSGWELLWFRGILRVLDAASGCVIFLGVLRPAVAATVIVVEVSSQTCAVGGV